MGRSKIKKKTIEAKKRQRRKQKLKKRLNKKENLITQNSSKNSGSPPDVPSTVVHSSSITKIANEVNVESGEGYYFQESSRDSTPDSFSSFGSPGTPPPTPSTIDGDSTEGEATNVNDIYCESYFQESVEERDKEMLHEIESYPLEHQCEALKELLHERTQSMHYYRDKVDSLELEMNDLSRECKRKIQSVRKVWRDKIFNEGD